MSQTTGAERLLAHEIENGLLSLEIRLRRLLGPSSSKEEVERCLVEVEALRALARDYLLLATARFDSVPFPLRVVLEPLRERYEPIAGARGVVLRIAETGAEVEAKGDPRATERILSNLLANAIEFSPEGGVVSLRVCGAGAKVEVEVQDAGIGIPPEDQQRIFDPFVRLDRERAGAGLGLTLARTLAEAQGGALLLSSEPGRGSLFLLSLPAK